jgi:hypothetical protein
MITHDNADQMQPYYLAEIECLRKSLRAETALKEYWQLQAEMTKQKLTEFITHFHETNTPLAS